MSEVLVQQTDLQTDKAQDAARAAIITHTYNLPQFVGLFEEDDSEKKFLRIVTQLIKGKIAVSNYKINEDESIGKEMSFQFRDKDEESESSYLFRLFDKLPVIMKLSDEIMGRQKRSKSVELVLSKFKNEKAIRFLNVAGADALDKLVFVTLMHIFLRNGVQKVELYSIFADMPKSLYVIYLNRLMQDSCIPVVQKLMKAHKPDIIDDAMYLSITPRLFDLVSNKDVDMI